MLDIREQLKSCGKNVNIDKTAHIHAPHRLTVGNDVTITPGFHLQDELRIASIGNHVTFYPNCFIQGSGELVIEDHVTFYPGVYLSVGNKENSLIHIGHHSHFAPYAVLYGHGSLRIGPYCNIAAHTVFSTVGHDYHTKDQLMADAPTITGPITLEEDVWIGANATIIANTHIAKGTVIGANAVVTHDTQSRGIYIGVPARHTRNR